MENKQSLATKQDLVVKLYALRAGLSVLSEIHDEAKEIIRKIAKMNDEIYACKNKQNYAEQQVRQKQKDYLEKIDSQTKCANRSKSELRTFEREENQILTKFEKSKKLITVFSILSISSLIVSVVGLCLAFRSITLGIMGGIASQICIISCVVLGLIRDNKKCTMPQLKKTQEELSYWRTRASAEQNKLNDLLANKESTFAEIEQCRDKIIDDYNHEIELAEQKIQNTLTLISTRFQAAHKAMQEQFGSVLDERDWGNVDLIIFNYETGRARDLRDALIQVDKERRNERLIEAVQSASNAITSSVQRGFGSLQSAMDIQFKRLDQSIAANASQQTQALGQHLGQIAQISSEQEALLNKIYESSDEMAEDIEYMRNIAARTY